MVKAKPVYGQRVCKKTGRTHWVMLLPGSPYYLTLCGRYYEKELFTTVTKWEGGEGKGPSVRERKEGAPVCIPCAKSAGTSEGEGREGQGGRK